jgi:hypothetical protein
LVCQVVQRNPRRRRRRRSHLSQGSQSPVFVVVVGNEPTRRIWGRSGNT